MRRSRICSAVNGGNTNRVAIAATARRATSRDRYRVGGELCGAGDLERIRDPLQRKVFEIAGDDDTCPTNQCCGHDMLVIGVGQAKGSRQEVPSSRLARHRTLSSSDR